MPDPPTLNIYGVHRMNKSDNLELTCRYVYILYILYIPQWTDPNIQWSSIIVSIWQRSAVPAVDDPTYKHSLLHYRLQWIGTLLHNTVDLQCNCQWNWTVPVLLQRPESWRWQDFSSGLCVCPWYDSFFFTILVLMLYYTEELYSKCASANRQWSIQKVIFKWSLILVMQHCGSHTHSQAKGTHCINHW